MTQFYNLQPIGGNLFGRKWAYGETITPTHYGEAALCPVCHSAVTLMRWLPPYRIKLSRSKPEWWGDFVFGVGFSLLVSARFKSIYEKEGLTGIAEFSPPVDIVRLGNIKAADFTGTLPTYYEIYVPWGGADQDDEASCLNFEYPEKITCPYCRKAKSRRWQSRVIFKENSWDGSDIFQPIRAPGGFYISPRFKEVVERYQLTNLWIIPSENFSYDDRQAGKGLYKIAD